MICLIGYIYSLKVSNTMSKTVYLLIILSLFSGCILPFSSGGNSVYSTDHIYLDYPHLMNFRDRYQDASFYYYAGKYEKAITAGDSLITDIDDLIETGPPAEFCAHLDSLKSITTVLRDKAAEDLEYSIWSEHASEVLDSIARNTVVEEEIEVVYNWKTEYWLDYFQGRGRRHFQKWLERVERYRGIIEPILVENELTRDLLYLAVIESGLNPRARSSANAVGPWQFMSGTGRLFNLRINWWIDERMDFVASTYAAVHYLKYLYSLFGNWSLALAGYNAGENRIHYLINKQETRNYWRLSRLPSQTRLFVPKFMAALEIGRNPGKYGFRIPEVQPMEFDQVTVSSQISLRHIAKAASCTYTRIKKLNPALMKWATPPNMRVTVKVPSGSGDAVRKMLAEIDSDERITWHRHTIERGETLSDISERYGIVMSELIRINDISNPRRIRAGSYLMVPVNESSVASGDLIIEPAYMHSPDLPDKLRVSRAKVPAGYRKHQYTIKPGDSLSEIARRFNTSIGSLRSWNDLKYTSLIKAGDKLLVYLPPGTEPPRTGGNRVSMIYVVKEGDTLISISRKYNTTVEDLLRWNGDIDGERLYPGNKIKILVDTDQLNPVSSGT
ncbi:MAG: LysM peptidoglycan-binding domain-containing protein [Candidatus Latescibacteria bacterium]|nr:LysM peptidoglycan-binding domain-containing protein [bacterium]MBD3423563.1 LysM peptidoglycan-binding domain-containing protein [Candidatus Latescibacterota bacterium]